MTRRRASGRADPSRMFSAGAALCLVMAAAPAASPQTQSQDARNEETVCDAAGLMGAALGLCNAYCEAMDCEGETPNARSEACLVALDRYKAHTEQPIPCARAQCPCWGPEDIDVLLSACEADGLEVACHGRAPREFSYAAMECTGPGVARHLRTRSWQVGPAFELAGCSVSDVPRLFHGEAQGITIEQGSACRRSLTDRFDDCDTGTILP